MKNLEDCGNPAFPTFDGDTYNGMSLRDWFAGMALQGMLPNCKAGSPESVPAMLEKVSELAYQTADAMIQARKK